MGVQSGSRTLDIGCRQRRLVIARSVATTPKMLTWSCLLAAVLLFPSAFADANEAIDAACLDAVNITFSPFPPVKFEFEASPSSEAVSMNHLYSITNYFISLVIAKPGVPKALLDEKMLKDPIAVIGRDHKMILGEFKGLLALVAIGLFLALVVPFVGVIVLCCRCCRRCGGAKNVAEKKGDTKWRGFLGLFLFFAVVAMLFAIVCAFVTNSYIPGGIDGISVQADHTISDVSQLINKTKAELDTLLVTNYGEFQGNLEKRLDTCTKSVGDDFSGLISGPPFSDVKNITENLQMINAKMGTIQDSVGKLNGIIQKMGQTVPDIKRKLQSAADECNKDGSSQGCGDISKAAEQVFEIKEVDLTEFNKLKKSVEDLKPDELAKQVSQALDPTARKEAFLRDVGEKVEALKRKLTDTGAKLTDISAKLDPTTHLTPSMFNHEASGVRNMIATAKPYVAYYNYATLAIAAVLAFVLLAYVLGLTWGGCGSRDGSCSRGSGGSWLSAGGTIFILAFFIPMLVSTVFFAVGIVGQRSTCDLALDLGSPEAESLIRFAYERALPEKEGPKRGGVEYINADVVVGVVRRFAECRDTPRGLYGLLGEELVANMTRSATKNGGGGGGGGISFELLLDDGKRLDFDAETKAFMDEVRKLNFRDVVSKELDEKLENVEKIDLEAVLNKIVDYKAKLDKSVVPSGSIPSMKERLQKMKNGKSPTVAGMLDDVIQQLDRIKDNIGEIEDSKPNLKDALTSLETLLRMDGKPFNVFAKEKIDQIKTTLDEITLNVTNKAELYKDKFVEFANVYVNHTRGQVKEHVGDCRPAYAVYQASVNAVCSNVLLPFNGYWFSVGAFMVIGVPALILALCLASLYHRVDPSLAILESLSRGDSDHVSGGSYMDSDTIPLARVNRKRRQGGGGGGGSGGGGGGAGRGVYDNRDGYLHDISPEYRDHSAHQQPPHRTVAGVASPGVAYVPAPTYQYSRDPGLPPYGKGYQPMPPALSQRVPSGEWDASGQFGAKPPPYYYPGA
ncbi:unnamed protein product [Ixodes persulcatus]